MNSIRIGNDINIAWSIYRCGDAEPLTVSALTLYMTCGYRKVQVQDFKVDGNKITFTFHGKDQANTGIYGLTLVGNEGKDGMFTVDACGAFKLVGSQCAGCLDTDGVEVDLRSDIQAPANGLSAYEIAVLNGFQGTEEEWLDSLKQPAVDAAEEADKAAQSATDAAGKADTAAGTANEAAAAATKAAGGATEAAAQATEAAGEAGKAASAATEASTLANQAASGANSAKNAANEAAQEASQAAETANNAAKAANDAASAANEIAGEVSANNEQWQEAESQRQAAEEKRQQDTQEAISGANTARDAANQAAQDANTAAEAANEAAQGIDAKIATKQDTLVSGENIKSINGIAIPGAGNIVLNQYIQHYKWATNAATTRKQVPAELRARDVKISYNNASGTYIVEQYQSDDISDAAWGDDANWKGCRTPLTPMFEAAGAVFNDETGYYEMNGLTDLTEDDILKSYKITANIMPTTSNGKSVYNIESFVSSSYRIRTNFPVQRFFRDFYEINLYCQNKLEVFTLLNDDGNTGSQPFYLRSGKIDGYYCSKLRKFIGILDVTYVETGTVNGGTNMMTALQELNIKRLKVDCTIFQKTAVVSLDSLSFLVENATNTEAITITVHPDVYAKLTDETNTEWYAVNTAAQVKQIAFATTQVARVALLSMNALPEVVNEGGELLAPAGYYITQAADTPTEERIFLTRKVLLPGEDTSRWRIATVAERQEQEDYFNTKLLEN